ncbi:PIN domain-containing protein, partial [Candidatus Micrarchaeota archaeon]|nr:PIN domain-containing protein [Candidatus Micrarchaeota archaeon]
EWEQIRENLYNYQILLADYSICELAATYSYQHNLSLGDALIYSTAKIGGKTLVTTDSDFKGLKDVLIVKRK